MFPSIIILGRQPALGLAELESLYGAENVQLIEKNVCLLNRSAKDINFARLGGSVKLAKVLTVLPTLDWQKHIRYISDALPKHIDYLPKGKIKLGLSSIGLNVSVPQMNRSALQLKTVIKTLGHSVRVIPNVDHTLNSAQVLHNQLTSSLGMELLLIRNGDKTILAQTVAEQDIDSYAKRDHGRPARDAKVGMLPPKLAQIIINLAAGDSDLQTAGVLLDPFCGTGVVLQEASLMNFDIAGSDLDERMVQYSDKNLMWLHRSENPLYKLEVADATKHQWIPAPYTIACETYLGRPFSAPPKPDLLQEVMQDVNLIHKKFLQNVAAQTQPGFRMCIAVPAWKVGNEFKHLKTLESLEELGYNRLKFVHAAAEDLIYHRQGQVVGRELVVLQRK